MSKIRVAVLALLVASSSAAVAQPARDASAPATHWYGWEVLVADGVSLSLVGIGAATDTQAVSVVGVTAYMLSGVMVHSVHRNTGRAAASGLAIRPVAAIAAAGLMLECGVCGDRANPEAAIGVLVAGSLFDAMTGWETTRITPIVEPNGTRGLALVGAF